MEFLDIIKKVQSVKGSLTNEDVLELKPGTEIYVVFASQDDYMVGLLCLKATLHSILPTHISGKDGDITLIVNMIDLSGKVSKLNKLVMSKFNGHSTDLTQAKGQSRIFVIRKHAEDYIDSIVQSVTP